MRGYRRAAAERRKWQRSEEAAGLAALSAMKRAGLRVGRRPCEPHAWATPLTMVVSPFSLEGFSVPAHAPYDLYRRCLVGEGRPFCFKIDDQELRAAAAEYAIGLMVIEGVGVNDSLREAGALLGVNHATVRRWATDCGLPLRQFVPDALTRRTRAAVSAHRMYAAADLRALGYRYAERAEEVADELDRQRQADGFRPGRMYREAARDGQLLLKRAVEIDARLDEAGAPDAPVGDETEGHDYDADEARGRAFEGLHAVPDQQSS